MTVAKKRKATRKATVTKSKPDSSDAYPKLYNGVVKAAELRGLNLTRVDFTVAPEYFTTAAAERELKYGCEDVSVSVSGDVAAGVFRWALSVHAAETSLLSCTAEYVVTYDGVGGCDENAVKGFVERVGKFASYPYFRAQAASLNWNAGANLPVLPVLKS